MQVLTTGYWPTYAVLGVNLPPEMVRCTQVFKDYYDHNNSKRRLTWMFGIGNTTVRGVFGKKSYDLQLTTLQAITMLAFNAEDAAGEVGFESLLEKCNYPNEHLKRVLHSLSCGKYKVIVKTPASATIKETDSFKFNPNFATDMRRGPGNISRVGVRVNWGAFDIRACRYSSVTR